jgi:predicted dehydrogenase
MMKTVRLGIIGVGSMGRYHMERMPQIRNVELTAVCDIVAERAERAASERQCAAYTDHRALLRDRACDAVLIATPHYAHTTVGADALRAGLHVLVEKPISVHKADCERLVGAHAGPSQIFAVMFNQRTDPRYRRLRELVQGGALGTLDRVTWIVTDWFRTDAYYAFGTWRATWAGEGGGLLQNQCPHNLDLWQWIFGMPRRVRGFCRIGRKHDIEVEDEVTAYLEYDSGCSGVFISSTGEAPGTNRLEVAGDGGRVVIERDALVFTRNEVSAREFIRTSPDLWACPAATSETTRFQSTGGQHVEILQNFVDAIVDGAPLIAPAPEGAREVELANAVFFSSETGKTVELPLDAAAYERMLKRKIRQSRFVKSKRLENPDAIQRSY